MTRVAILICWPIWPMTRWPTVSHPIAVAVCVTVCAKFCESDCKYRGVGKCDFKCFENYKLDQRFECELLSLLLVVVKTNIAIGQWCKPLCHHHHHHHHLNLMLMMMNICIRICIANLLFAYNASRAARLDPVYCQFISCMQTAQTTFQFCCRTRLNNVGHSLNCATITSARTHLFQ